MRTFDASLTLSDGRPVFVEYSAEGGSRAVTCGPPEHCDPGEPPEITITRAWLGADGEGDEYALPDHEAERLCEHLAMTHEEPSDDYLD